jgi:hypothetical protein
LTAAVQVQDVHNLWLLKYGSRTVEVWTMGVKRFDILAGVAIARAVFVTESNVLRVSYINRFIEILLSYNCFQAASIERFS